MPPLPPALPILAPPEDDSRRSALCRKPGWPDLGGVAGAGGVWVSGFLASFGPGATAGPGELACPTEGLWVGFPPAFGGGTGLPDGGFELDENLELMLVIHELRRPREGDLGSFEPLAEGGVGGAGFSEASFVWREDL